MGCCPITLCQSWRSWLRSRTLTMMQESGVTNDDIIDVMPKVPTGDRTAQFLDDIDKGKVTFNKFKCATMGSKDSTVEYMRGVMDSMEAAKAFPDRVLKSEPWHTARQFVNGELKVEELCWNKNEKIHIDENDEMVWSIAAWNKRGGKRVYFFVGYVVMGKVNKILASNHVVQIKPCPELLAAQLIRTKGLGYDTKNECYRYLSI